MFLYFYISLFMIYWY